MKHAACEGNVDISGVRNVTYRQLSAAKLQRLMTSFLQNVHVSSLLSVAIQRSRVSRLSRSNSADRLSDTPLRLLQGLLTSASKHDGTYRYNFATVPFLAELLKLVISSALLQRQKRVNPGSILSCCSPIHPACLSLSACMSAYLSFINRHSSGFTVSTCNSDAINTAGLC